MQPPFRPNGVAKGEAFQSRHDGNPRTGLFGLDARSSFRNAILSGI